MTDAKIKFLNFVEGLQANAENSLKEYLDNGCIFPNDAIYLSRVNSLNQFGDFIDELVTRSEKPLPVVLSSLRFDIGKLNNCFPFIGEAIDAIIEEFGEKS